MSRRSAQAQAGECTVRKHRRHLLSREKTRPCLTRLHPSASTPHCDRQQRPRTAPPARCVVGSASAASPSKHLRHHHDHGNSKAGINLALTDLKVAVSAAGAVPRSSVAAKLRAAQVRDSRSVNSRRCWMLLRWWLISHTRKKGLFAALAVTAHAAQPASKELDHGKTPTLDEMMAIVAPPPPAPASKPKVRPLPLKSRPAWNASSVVGRSTIERQPWKQEPTESGPASRESRTDRQTDRQILRSLAH